VSPVLVGNVFLMIVTATAVSMSVERAESNDANGLEKMNTTNELPGRSDGMDSIVQAVLFR
jgi:hypothetical protein